MRKMYRCLTCVSLVLALTACGKGQQAESAKEKKAAAPVAQSAPVVKPTGDKAQTAGEAVPPAPTQIKGKVAETLDASGYTYVRLNDGSGKDVWAAIPKTDLKVGQEVTLQGGSVMDNFNSKTLNRTFDKIIFSSGVAKGDGKEAAPGSFGAAVQQQGAAAGASSGSAGNVVPFADLKITKAAGPDGQTVSDLYEKAASLDKKKVDIRGQVVKVSKNIMGKNWVHLQDGTGDPKNPNHDLVVTTMDSPEKGDVVSVEGTVAANKDFGSGYKYEVIVEDAKVTKDAGAKASK